MSDETNDKKLDVTCDIKGAFECSEDAQGFAVHRLCVAGEWVSTTCAKAQICRESGCASQTTVCEATTDRCLDLKTKEHCLASELRFMPEKDVPDASKLKSLSKSFILAKAFNAPIGHWDSSKVTDISMMFYKVSKFNQPIGSWMLLM